MKHVNGTRLHMEMTDEYHEPMTAIEEHNGDVVIRGGKMYGGAGKYAFTTTMKNLEHTIARHGWVVVKQELMPITRTPQIKASKTTEPRYCNHCKEKLREPGNWSCYYVVHDKKQGHNTSVCGLLCCECYDVYYEYQLLIKGEYKRAQSPWKK